MAVTRKETVQVAMVLLWAVGACSWWSNKEAKTWPLTATVPAAHGEVVTHKWEGRGREVEVKVDSLAPPDQIAPSATTYIVWFEPAQKNAPAQNMGVLRLNQDLSGDLKTQSAFVDFDVIVTAENSAGVTQPSGKEVLRTAVRGPSPTAAH